MRNPVFPTSGAIAGARPLIGEYRVAGGFWGEWRAKNERASIDHGIEWMDRAGYLHNLRLAAGDTAGEYRGPHWMDSDLYKLLEAIAWVPNERRDAAHAAFYEETVSLLERVQLPDGYLNSYYQTTAGSARWTDFAFGHEMYVGGHLIQAGIAGVRNLGDSRLLGVAERFASHLIEKFGEHGEPRIDGHPEIEMALVELYRTTLDERYLQQAKLFVDRRGCSSLGPGHFGLLYCQDAVPLRQMTALDGHAVRALYYAAGATDVASETGDVELLGVLQDLWDDLVATKSYVTGGVGSRHFHEAIGDAYELPPDRAYCESCASIAKVMWAHRLHLATGRVDVLAEAERVLFNGFAASTSADRTHFWYRNPLYQREAITAAPEDALLEERIDIGTRAAWYDTSCCPPNIMRTIASLDGYITSESAGTVRLNLLVPGVLRTDVGGEAVSLEVQTDYPATGHVRLRSASGRVTRTALRIPDWADRVAVDGNPRPDAAGGTYLELEVGAVPVDIDLEMRPRLIRPHRRIDAVRGQVAVARGPVLHAFEARDLADPDSVHDIVISAQSVPLESTERTDPLLGPDLELAGGIVYDAPPPDPYSSGGIASPIIPLSLRTRPYATWANRGSTAMRVWVPAAEDLAPPTVPGASANNEE